jgi:release factor glutamine methyltransferase
MDDTTWTIGRLLAWTTDFLTEKGADSPRLDAEVLLAHARGCRRIELYTTYEEVADEPLRERFRQLVRQRATGMPVAYLVGHREFFSLTFEVSPDVLIPRPETELLVVRALDLVKEGVAASRLTPSDNAAPTPDPPGDLSIADVGTGSGVLAVCLARHLPAARVTAVDLSPAAIEVASANARRHQVAERIRLLVSDLLAEVAAETRFDLIVSNPPYITTAEMEQLDRDVRQFEPHQALHGGTQGTDLIERLLVESAQRLVAGGRLLMEISPAIAPRVEQLIGQQEGLRHVRTHPDLARLPRVVEVERHEGTAQK